MGDKKRSTLEELKSLPDRVAALEATVAGLVEAADQPDKSRILCPHCHEYVWVAAAVAAEAGQTIAASWQLETKLKTLTEQRAAIRAASEEPLSDLEYQIDDPSDALAIVRVKAADLRALQEALEGAEGGAMGNTIPERIFIPTHAGELIGDWMEKPDSLGGLVQYIRADVVADMFGEIDLTPEQIDTYLRKHGYDPEELGHWGQRIADEELAKAKKAMQGDEGVGDG